MGLSDKSMMKKITKRSGNPDLRPFVFITDEGHDREALVNTLLHCVHVGVGGIIPLPRRVADADGTTPADELRRFRDFNAMLLPEAARLGLRVVFTLATCIENAVISAQDSLWDESMRSRVLVRRAYYCTPHEHVSLMLHDGLHMATVAFNEECAEVIDLRGTDKDGLLEWDAPQGNWKIIEYICTPDYDCNRPDLLSYEASTRFLDLAYGLFADLLEPYIGTTVTHLYFRNLAFNSRNRHDWNDSFNEVFTERFGFDPSPHYPALYSSAGADSAHLKALFSDCRARMLRDGFLLAAEQFAEQHGLALFGSITEPKLTECAPITGDALLDNTASPCAVFDRAYLYGMNSVKLAAGAAFGRSIRDIFVELYRSYPDYSSELLMRDAAHAFARGANLPAMHLPHITEENGAGLRELFEYTASVRNCLCRGRQVSDIAVIYPIYYLHSQVNLYDAEIEGFEYPDTPYNADYMTVINSICLYSGHDITLLHPDVIVRSAKAENGLLRLEGMSDEGGFRVVVFPAQRMCSLECLRILESFYNDGGKIIATGELPRTAFEYDPQNPDRNDNEICEITDRIFGHDDSDPSVIREYCHNRNDNGGEAYFLYFSLTAADGTNMADSRMLAEALDRLGVAFDVYAPQMPHYESTGALNNPYNEYTRLGLQRHLPDGGMFSHIHKRHGIFDTYFFANTTDRQASTPVFLRGAHEPFVFDPRSGRRGRADYTHVLVLGRVYTRFNMQLERTGSLIVVSENADDREMRLDTGALPDCTAEALGRQQ